MGDDPRPPSRVVVNRQQRRVNGELREVLVVSYADHAIEAIVLDMADQWDFMEMAGSQLDNQAWVNTALLATSVIGIDGVPQPSGPKSREQIRSVLRKLGETGLDALQEAFDSPRSSDEQSPSAEIAAGN